MTVASATKRLVHLLREAMAKHIVDVDAALLTRASAVLGTTTVKDTVNTALEEVITSELRRRHVERLVTMDGLDLDDPDVMSGAWR